MATKKSTAPRAELQATSLPLFYTRPVLLDSTLHADMGIMAKAQTYNFAAKANAIPVNLIEFPQIAHYYPIAFARDAMATPVAVVGVRDDENLFVDAKGNWASNTYIPAYVRRYPFILSESPDGEQMSLCIDDAPGILTKGGDRFFDDKQQATQMAKNAMEYCRSYHMAAKQTQAFGQALLEAGVLVERTAELTLKAGSRVSFSGFRIIDEEKFNKLPEKTFIEWRGKGWLAGAYAHLFSGMHWGAITRMLNDRK
jgi:hypothetical protein